MEGTNQAVMTPAQASSPMPTASEPSLVAQSVTSPPSPYQASAPTYQTQAQAPQAPQAYQAAAAPQASAQAGNPWQEAFQALTANLNTSSPSLAQASPSAYQTTPTPQLATPAAWASAPQAQVAQYSAPQTSSHQVSTPAYTQQAPMQGQAQGQVRDAYLSQVSDQSLEVLQHFGAEAPALLNQYACAVEDALVEQVQRGQSQTQLLKAAGEERTAMNIMLTNPDVLADYVNDFYGPKGPYPTPTKAEVQALQQHQSRAQFAQDIARQEQNSQVPPNFQRPEMKMPTPGRSSNPANDFWGGFSHLMDNNPENAWKFLSQAPQGALQTKMLVQDT